MTFMTGSFYDPALQKLLCLSRSCCQSIGAGNGEFFILLRAGGATDTDRSNDLPVDDDRNTTLERREVVKTGHGGPPLVDHVFEELRGPFEHDRSPRLPDRNV